MDHYKYCKNIFVGFHLRVFVEAVCGTLGCDAWSILQELGEPLQTPTVWREIAVRNQKRKFIIKYISFLLSMPLSVSFSFCIILNRLHVSLQQGGQVDLAPAGQWARLVMSALLLLLWNSSIQVWLQGMMKPSGWPWGILGSHDTSFTTFHPAFLSFGRA